MSLRTLAYLFPALLFLSVRPACAVDDRLDEFTQLTANREVEIGEAFKVSFQYQNYRAPTQQDVDNARENASLSPAFTNWHAIMTTEDMIKQFDQEVAKSSDFKLLPNQYLRRLSDGDSENKSCIYAQCGADDVYYYLYDSDLFFNIAPGSTWGDSPATLYASYKFFADKAGTYELALKDIISGTTYTNLKITVTPDKEGNASLAEKYPDYGKVKLGDSTKQVRKILGKPNTFTKHLANNTKDYIYSHIKSGHYVHRYISFSNDVVYEISTKTPVIERNLWH